MIAAFCITVAIVTGFACCYSCYHHRLLIKCCYRHRLCLFVAIVTTLPPDSTPSSVPTALTPSDAVVPFHLPTIAPAFRRRPQQLRLASITDLADLYRKFIPNEWLMVDCWLVVVKSVATCTVQYDLHITYNLVLVPWSWYPGTLVLYSTLGGSRLPAGSNVLLQRTGQRRYKQRLFNGGGITGS